MKRFTFRIMILLVSLVLTSWLDAAPAEIDGVESGRRALQESNDYPWYDAQADDVQSTHLAPHAPPPEVSGRTWRARDRAPQAKPARKLGMTGFWQVIEVIAWIAVVGVLVGLIYIFAQMILRNWQDESTIESVEFEEPISDDRIEHLPFQVATGRSDFLAEAKRLAAAGRYGEAIVQLFSYELLQLDRHQHIRLAKGKTNRQYVRELRRRPDLSEILTRTMLVFEDFFFGHHEIAQERFETCWNQVESFRERILQESVGSAGVAKPSTGASMPGVVAKCLLVASCLLVLNGCSREGKIDTTYGKRRGYPASASLNGTTVLSQMFQDAGAKIASTSRLSKTIASSQVVVWAPNSFRLPEQNASDYFDDWLSSKENRTLVYIARDYDAALDYWKRMVTNGPLEETVEYQRKLATAVTEFERDRRHVIPPQARGFTGFFGDEIPQTQTWEWFQISRLDEFQRVQSLQGPWAQGIDPSQTQITICSRLTAIGNDPVTRSSNGMAESSETEAGDATEEDGEIDAEITDAEITDAEITDAEITDEFDEESELESPEEMNDEPEEDPEFGAPYAEPDYHFISSDDVEVLLATSSDEILAMRIRSPYWQNSQLIVVINGSWLLNYSLVNHEHRKLAESLISDCDCESARVTFLETGTEGARESSEMSDPFWHLLTLQPLGPVLMHAIVLGILYCFAAFPIFGRARTLATESVSDFGKHTIAFGKQLAKSRDAVYAQTRLKTYHQLVRKEQLGAAFDSSAHGTPLPEASQSSDSIHKTN